MEYIISVIVSLRNGELIIKQTLDSILNQKLDAGKIEILVVDRNSTDTSVAIVKEIQRDCPCVTLLELGHNSNTDALNLGLRNAMGKYVSFINPGCVLKTGIYEEMVHEAESRGLDVVFGQALKTVQTSAAQSENETSDVENTQTEEVPISEKLYNTLHSAIEAANAVTTSIAMMNNDIQNLLIRRQFLLDHDLWHLSKGLSAKELFNLQLILATAQTGLMDQVIYTRGLADVAKQNNRLNNAMLREYYRGHRGFSFILRLLKAWAGFKVRRNKKRLRNILTLCLRRILYPSLYRVFCLRKVKSNKIVFIEYQGEQPSNNFTQLIQAVQKRQDLNCVVSAHMQSSLTSWQLLKWYIYALYLISDAKTVFIDKVPLPSIDAVNIRPETHIQQVWHACGAFKKWGYAAVEGKFGASAETLKKYPIYRNQTHVFVSSPGVVPFYEEAMNLQDQPGVVIPTGVSRTDVFFDPERKRAAYQNVYFSVPEAQGKKILLYAPTFRGHERGAWSPQSLNLRLLSQEFSKEYVLMIKHHPLVLNRQEIPDSLKSFAFDVTNTLTIDDLIMTSDVCIADYSSLIFEFALLDRPMVFFADDLEDYYDWRGFFEDYLDFIPGPFARTTEDVVKFLHGLPNSFNYEKLHVFRDKYMASCDGHSTERILSIIEKNMC